MALPAEGMLALAQRLYPICRSLTGDGVRTSLDILREHIPLEVHEVASGTAVFDWSVPDEWNVREAYIEDSAGNRVVDFREHNLHLVSYSVPVDLELELDELQSRLYSLPEAPDAIPYVCSYYQPDWGFCLAHRKRVALQPGRYRVRIDSTLAPGHLTYADLVLPGSSSEEVLFSTYICHPSMANNELSGPVVATALASWLLSRSNRLTYRFVFIPETIGSLVYISRHLDKLKSQTIAGYNLSCLGDDRAYSYLPTRYGDTLADRVALHVLGHTDPRFLRYSFLERGGDERQYCSPGIDLPVVTLCRSLFRKFSEYHSSLDDFNLVTQAALLDSLTLLQRCVTVLESNLTYISCCLGEPQLGRRGLYGHKSSELRSVERLCPHLDVLAYADGRNDLLGIAERLGYPVWTLISVVEELQKHHLLRQLT